MQEEVKVGICESLWSKEKELKKHSVFLQETDKKTDFEFFVFIDQGDEKNPPFLKELFHYLENKDGFACPEHEEQLKEWLGKEAEQELITPLNWLKIAIERYPYRLFVITDRKKCFNKIRSEFIKKRICFIKKKDFYNILENDNFVCIRFNNKEIKCSSKYASLKLWLFKRWLEHLNGKVTGYKVNNIIIEIDFKNGGDSGFLPITLPPNLIKEKDQSENNIQNITIEVNLSKNNQNSKCLEFKFKRHGLPGINTLLKDYGESLSGSQSTFSLFSGMDSYENELKIFLSFLITEIGLLIWAIIDERILRWWVEYCKDPCLLYTSPSPRDRG